MGSRWSLRKQNRGASLIAVMVALVFVMAIAAIILNMTITNIRMKEIEQSGKKNFYSAEEVVDELTVGLNDIASQAMQEAYAEILTDYRNIMVSGADIQKEFTEIYIEKLEALFWNGVPDTHRDTRKTTDPYDVGTVIYAMGYYNPDNVKTCMATASNQAYWVTTQDEATFTADYEEGIFILKNVKIVFEDARGYETTISTDMVFHTPTLNFNNNNMVKEYMRYALIADTKIAIDAANVEVNGSAYAGAGGIVCTHPANASMTGSNIVTRGDISVDSGAEMTVGDGATRIWAENIRTTGSGSASVLTLNGNSYISDDLVLNGVNSTVTLYGNYYGYNFQDTYDALRTVTDSTYSSAMMINARGCKMDLSGLNYLLLAGRTYISRGSAGSTQNTDVMLGESIAVRTNQLAYYVPERFLDVTDTDNAVFNASGVTDFEDYIQVTDIMSYLNASHPITTYYYRSIGAVSQRYYLNFASEQKANDFFAAYYLANRSRVDAQVESYAGNNAIIIDNATLYTLKGDIMYQSEENAMRQEVAITIAPENWKPGTGGADNGIYWDYADRLAITYKSLQTYLEESHAGITSDNVRFMNGSSVDKTIDSLMENLIDVDAIKADYPQSGGTMPKLEEKTPLSGATNTLIAVVNNEGMDPYIVTADCRQGIVIATGDVQIRGDFTGMVIAGGTISFTAGVTVDGDEVLVSRMFKEDIARIGTGDSPLFATYFRDYSSLSDSVIGLVRIDEYLTFENWTKNGN